MFVRREVSPGEVVLEVHGPLSSDSAIEFHRQLDEIVGGRWSTVTLDLSATDAVNSSSLGKMMLFRERLATQGRLLRIRGCSEEIYRTLLMIQFDKLIPIDRQRVP